MGPIGCTETLVNIYHSSLRNNLEELFSPTSRRKPEIAHIADTCYLLLLIKLSFVRKYCLAFQMTNWLLVSWFWYLSWVCV